MADSAEYPEFRVAFLAIAADYDRLADSAEELGRPTSQG